MVMLFFAAKINVLTNNIGREKVFVTFSITLVLEK